MFLSRNKKNNLYPCKPQFYYIKVGFKGAKLYRRVFVMIIRGGSRMNSEEVRFDKITVLYVFGQTDLSNQYRP